MNIFPADPCFEQTQVSYFQLDFQSIPKWSYTTSCRISVQSFKIQVIRREGWTMVTTSPFKSCRLPASKNIDYGHTVVWLTDGGIKQSTGESTLSTIRTKFVSVQTIDNGHFVGPDWYPGFGVVESEPSQEFPADNLLKASKVNASYYPSMAQIYADYLMQSSWIISSYSIFMCILSSFPSRRNLCISQRPLFWYIIVSSYTFDAYIENYILRLLTVFTEMAAINPGLTIDFSPFFAAIA
jgi:hypothetical protein